MLFPLHNLLAQGTNPGPEGKNADFETASECNHPRSSG